MVVEVVGDVAVVIGLEVVMTSGLVMEDVAASETGVMVDSVVGVMAGVGEIAEAGTGAGVGGAEVVAVVAALAVVG